MLRMCVRAAGRGCVDALSCLLLAVLLVVVLFGARLAMGPMRLDGLIPEIERQINGTLDGWRIEIGGAQVAWDAVDHGVGLRFENVALVDPNGVRAAGAPVASVAFATGPALRGVAAPTTLRLDGADALLVRARDERFRLAMLSAGPAAADVDLGAWPAAEPAPGASAAPSRSTPSQSARSDAEIRQYEPNAAALAETSEGEEDQFAAIAAIIDGMAGSNPDVSALTHFRRIDISSLRLRYRDDISGEVLVAPDAHLEIVRTSAGLEATLEAGVLAEPGAAPVRIAVSGVRRPADDTVALAVEFDDAPARIVARQAPKTLAALSAIDGNVSGQIAATLRPTERNLISLAAELSADDTRLMLDGAPRLEIDRFDLDLAYDGAADAVELRRLHVAAAGADVTLSGQVAFEREADRLIPSGAHGAFEIEHVRLDEGANFAKSMTLDGGRLEFAFDAAPFRLRASRIELRSGDTLLGAEGELALEEGVFVGFIDGGFNSFGVEMLTGFWPIHAAPGARNWIAANILAGRVDGGALRYDIGPGAGELDLNFSFQDVVSSYLQNMPAIQGAAGSGRLTLSTLDLEVDAAFVEVPGVDQPLQLARSTMTIPSFGPEVPVATINVKGEGRAAAVLALLDHEPLLLVRKLKLNPLSVAGTTEVTAKIDVPLSSTVKVADVEAEATAQLRSIGLIAPGLERPVGVDRGTLTANTRGLRLQGDGAVDGYRSQIEWREVFRPSAGRPRSQFDVVSRLEHDDLLALGVPEDRMRGGDVRVDLAAALVDGRPVALSGAVDLAGADLAIRELGWFKPPGVAGALNFNGEISKDDFSLPSISGEAAGLTLQGSAMIDDAWRLQDLTLRRFQIGEATDIGRVWVSRLPSDGFRVSVQGRSLDLRPTITAMSAPADARRRAGLATPLASGEPSGVEISADLQLEQLLLMDNAILRNVAGLAEISSGGSISADVKGEVVSPSGAAAPVVGAYHNIADAHVLNVKSRRAGEFLSAIDVFEGARDGDAQLRAQFLEDGTIAGQLELDNLVVENAPVLAQILSITGVFDRLSSGGLTFSRVRAPFRIVGQKVHVDDAAATGPTVGVSLNGFYDREQDRLNFEGAVSPAYAINGLLQNVPVLGELVGRDGEGLFATTYTIRGSAKDPDPRVHPLSTFAPGRLREIFRGVAPTEADDARPLPGDARDNER